MVSSIVCIEATFVQHAHTETKSAGKWNGCYHGLTDDNGGVVLLDVTLGKEDEEKRVAEMFVNRVKKLRKGMRYHPQIMRYHPQRM